MVDSLRERGSVNQSNAIFFRCLDEVGNISPANGEDAESQESISSQQSDYGSGAEEADACRDQGARTHLNEAKKRGRAPHVARERRKRNGGCIRICHPDA